MDIFPPFLDDFYNARTELFRIFVNHIAKTINIL